MGSSALVCTALFVLAYFLSFGFRADATAVQALESPLQPQQWQHMDFRFKSIVSQEDIHYSFKTNPLAIFYSGLRYDDEYVSLNECIHMRANHTNEEYDIDITCDVEFGFFRSYTLAIGFASPSRYAPVTWRPMYWRHASSRRPLKNYASSFRNRSLSSTQESPTVELWSI